MTGNKLDESDLFCVTFLTLQACFLGSMQGRIILMITWIGLCIIQQVHRWINRMNTSVSS